MNNSTFGLAVATIFCWALPAFALETGSAVDFDKQRIEILAEQQMLSQRLAKLSCISAVAGSNRSIAEQTKRTQSNINKSLEKLTEIGIQSDLVRDMRSAVSFELEKLESGWIALTSLSQNEPLNVSMSSDVIPEIDVQSLVVMVAAHQTSELLSQYGFKSTIHARLRDAVRLSERQSMLSQKMAKEACLIAANTNSRQNLRAFSQTVAEINRNLDDLTHGNFESRIPNAPTDEIRGALEEIHHLWQGINGFAQAIVANGSLEAEKLVWLSAQTEMVLKKMRQVTLHYREL